jgi:hypothetical protein
VALLVYKLEEAIEWDEMFPDGPGKIMNFLNKKL